MSSIDTFHPLSGLRTKLRGYYKFLKAYPAYRNKLVLIQFIPSIYCESEHLVDEECKAEERTSTFDYFVDKIPILK